MIGVDGCRAGWVVAEWRPGHGAPGLWLALRAEDWLRLGADATLVDMPVGLFADGRVRMRGCDRAARERLGPRRSSVFPPPTRDMLGATAHGPLGERGLSIQAFHLIPKIAELDTAIDASRQASVVEGHPELAFTRLAGHPLEAPKRTSEGRALRTDLLEAACPGAAAGIEALLAATPRKWLAPDDAVDAVVLAVTAAARLEDRAWRLPEGEPERDERGLTMEVWG